ncbi:MAG: DUF1330 domain-containing protein [Bacteroidota bacterium]
MPTYVTVMMTIHDPEVYTKYTDKTPAIVKRHGGKFLTRGEEVSTLEGTPYTGRMVLLEFPDRESVDAWHADPEYQEVVKHRHASSTIHMLLVQNGGANTADPSPKL